MTKTPTLAELLAQAEDLNKKLAAQPEPELLIELTKALEAAKPQIETIIRITSVLPPTLVVNVVKSFADTYNAALQQTTIRRQELLQAAVDAAAAAATAPPDSAV